MAGAKFTFRNLKKEDIKAIFELGKEHFGSPKQFSWDWSLAKLEEYLDSSFGTGIVCLDKDSIIGFALAQNKYSEQKPKVAWFTYILVNPNYQKKGIGDKLSKELLKELKKKGANEIITDIYEDNKSSIEFFKKKGFGIKERWFILTRKI